EFLYPQMNRRLFGEPEPDDRVGSFKSIYIGQAADKSVRQGAASGGAVTALLQFLLDKNEIDAAVVVTMDKIEPWKSRATIALSKEELLACRQSKYAMVALDEIFRGFLTEKNRRFAVVGLPCHIHGIRSLQKKYPDFAAAIKYCIGIFCGFNVSGAATEFLLKKLKVKKKEVASLEYRGGPWPGGFRVKTKDGRERFIPKHDYAFVNAFFVPDRCLLCPDLTNEFADISVGDVWDDAQELKGYSRIITRTATGEKLLQDTVAAGELIIRNSSREALLKSHSHLFRYKKDDFGVRFRLNHLRPQFGINFPKASLAQRLRAAGFYYLLKICRSPLGRGLLFLVPLGILQGLSRKLRK
ncbi:MAG: Coenzyme F420 hydrogenase/dehydrogenase, beta subunit C-terminal domain, partial [Candidatus Omnitrophota bacterium]